MMYIICCLAYFGWVVYEIINADYDPQHYNFSNL